jgi:ribonuclease Z
MRLTFLGTGSGAPTRTRNVSAVALQWDERAAFWLFDCGEATQHQIARSPLRLSRLDRLFFTHLHGDHLFGLPGLLASRSLQGGGEVTGPVTLHGPAGLADYVRASLGASHTHLAYPLHIETVAPGSVVYEDEERRVVCAPVSHGIESYAYAVIERAQTGRFDAEAARALGIPAGPL